MAAGARATALTAPGISGAFGVRNMSAKPGKFTVMVGAAASRFCASRRLSSKAMSPP